MIKTHEKTIAAGQHDEERKYWLNRLSGEWEKSILPYDPVQKKGVGGYETVSFQVTGELLDRLKKLYNDSDHRLHMILTAVVTVLLHKYTSNADIIMGAPAIKQEQEADFVNTVLVLRSRLDEGMTFKELLLQMRQTVTEATAHLNFPVEALPDLLGLPVSEGDGFPLFEVAVLLENIHDPGYLDHVQPRVLFSFKRTPDCLEGVIRYDSTTYFQSTLQRLAERLNRLFQTLLFKVDTVISDVEMMTPEEKEQLLVTFNDTHFSGAPKDKTLAVLFEEQVAATPEQIAVIAPSVHAGTRFTANDGMAPVTYRELDRWSNRLARKLCRAGVVADTLVGLMTAPSIEMAVGLLGILKAGGAYIPLEPGPVSEKLSFMLRDSGVNILVTQGKPPIHDRVSTVLDLDDPSLEDESGEELEPIAGPANAAYVIYTSGSTGRPRGVVVEHQQVVNTLAWRRQAYELGPGDTHLQLLSYLFDAFVISFFTPLISGARVLFLSDEAFDDINRVKEAMNRYHVTRLVSVPGLFGMILGHLTPEQTAGLKTVTLGGDRFPPTLLTTVREKNPHLEIVNEYGVTEAAVTSTCLRHQERENRPRIGRPTGNTQIYILTPNHHPQPTGIPGQLCIAGAGVTRGYLNQPELTAQKFIAMPPAALRGLSEGQGAAPPGPPTGVDFKQRLGMDAAGDTNSYGKEGERQENVRLFLSGDRARWLDDGTIELLGRMDFQVKIGGYRVEPGEIENRLESFPQVKEAAVAPRETNGGVSAFWAYLTGNEHEEMNLSQLREFLADRLPDYMVPAHFVVLEGMPRTSSGKIDRHKLLQMSKDARAEVEFAAPRTETETALAGIWKEMLELEQVGIRDNFFVIGGDSIKTLTLLRVINKAFNTQYRVVDLYENETIEKLAHKIDKQGPQAEQEDYSDTLQEMDDFKNQLLDEL